MGVYIMPVLVQCIRISFLKDQCTKECIKAILFGDEIWIHCTNTDTLWATISYIASRFPYFMSKLKYIGMHFCMYPHLEQQLHLIYYSNILDLYLCTYMMNVYVCIMSIFDRTGSVSWNLIKIHTIINDK